MQIKANASVVGADGKGFGHVRRVVIDPHNGEIRDIVVRQGVLLTEDRVVPIGTVADTSGEQVRLKISSNDADKLAIFEETFYVPLNGEGEELPPGAFAPTYYWYPPLMGYEPASYAGAVPPELLGYELRKERHIPLNTVALKEGATVKSRDDHEVGKLEQVLTAPGSDQATHLVVAEGLLHKTHKVIPLDWVDRIEEDHVYLAVPAQVVENLPVYEH